MPKLAVLGAHTEKVTFSTFKSRVRTSSQALCTRTVHALREPDSIEVDLAPNRLYALVELEVKGRFVNTDILSEAERIQVRFWESMLGPSLDNSLVLLNVRRLVPLKFIGGIYPELLEGPAKRRRGNHIELNQFEVAQCRVGCVAADDLSKLCIRVPAPYALLIASGRCTVVVLPDVVEAGFCTGAFKVPWDKLGLVDPPRKAGYAEGAVPSFENYQAIADVLRVAFQGAETEAERSRIAALVASMQALADDSDASVYQRRVLLSGPTQVVHHRRYRADFMVKVFMILSRTKSTTHLPHLLRDVAEIVFSATTLQHLEELIREGSRLAPSQSAISRCKLLFDGAFLLWMRQYNASLLSEGGAVGYLMADSSRQHAREFEAIWLLTVKKCDLLEALRMANQLIALRRFICMYVYTTQDVFRVVPMD